jgi:hypothetical protein
MEDSIHEYVLAQLKATKGKWPKVARETGLSKRTIEKIASEEIPNPGVLSVETLARYFRQAEVNGVHVTE